MGDVIRIVTRICASRLTRRLRTSAELRPRDTSVVAVPGPLSNPRLAEPRKLLATLEIINEGVLKGTRFRLERPVAHVGRHSDNEVHLADDTVSGSHATLARRGSGWVLTDHGSTNGTYVDGERITGDREVPGVAELRFGGVKMVFRPIGGLGGEPDTKNTKAVVGVSLEPARTSKG